MEMHILNLTHLKTMITPGTQVLDEDENPSNFVLAFAKMPWLRTHKEFHHQSHILQKFHFTNFTYPIFDQT